MTDRPRGKEERWTRKDGGRRTERNGEYIAHTFTFGLGGNGRCLGDGKRNEGGCLLWLWQELPRPPPSPALGGGDGGVNGGGEREGDDLLLDGCAFPSASTRRRRTSGAGHTLPQTALPLLILPILHILPAPLPFSPPSTSNPPPPPPPPPSEQPAILPPPSAAPSLASPLPALILPCIEPQRSSPMARKTPPQPKLPQFRTFFEKREPITSALQVGIAKSTLVPV